MVTAAQGDEVHVPKGAVIFRQGDPGHEMFVVSEGRIRLTIGTGGHEKEVAVLGPGQFFGELSLLSDEPRSATAEALEDSSLLVIGRDVFKMMMQDDLDIVFRMLNIQGQRLRHANVPIQELMERMGRLRIVANCLRRLAATNNQLPFTLEVDALAGDIGVTASQVSTTLADLAQSGIGAVRDGRWSIQSPGEVKKLIDALCTYAEAGTE